MIGVATEGSGDGYWGVPIARADQYKTAFVSSLGQFCYRRMGQGLTGSPSTYARMKDILTGAIPAPNPEPALADVMPDKTAFAQDVHPRSR